MNTTSMSFEDFTRLVLDALDAAKIEYMIGGSVGLLAWGEARTTRDFDLVINLRSYRTESQRTLVVG